MLLRRRSHDRRSSRSHERRSSGRRSSLVGSEQLKLKAKDAEKSDMKLGAEAEAVKPPTRRLLVTGTPHSGKSTLIRKLKYMYEGDGEPEERRRFAREIHKIALASFQVLLRAAEPNMRADSVKSEAAAMMALRRREMLSEETTSRLASLFQEEAVVAALASIEDPSLRQTCSYFMRRLPDLSAAHFVPEPEDLLYLSIPTGGRQETRLHDTPGGAVSLIEANSRDLFEPRPSGEVPPPKQRDVRAFGRREAAPHSTLTHRLRAPDKAVEEESVRRLGRPCAIARLTARARLARCSSPTRRSWPELRPSSSL